MAEAVSARRRLLALTLRERRELGWSALYQSLQSLTFIPFTAGITWFIDGVLHPPAARSRHTSLMFIVVFALANLALWALHGWFTVQAFGASQRVARTTTAELRRLVVDQLQRLSIGWFTRNGAAGASNKLTVDMGRIESFLGQVTRSLVPGVMLGLATFVYLLVLNLRLALLTLLMLPLQAIVIRAMSRRLDLLHAQVKDSGESFAERVSELVGSMRHIRGLGNDDHERERMHQSIERVRAAGLEAGLAMTWASLGLQMAHEYMPVLVWCVGGWMTLDGKVTIGQLVGFVGLLAFVQGGISAVAGAWAEWVSARAGAESLFALLDSDEVESDGEVVDCTLTGQISLTDVGFRYAGAERATLEHLDLELAPGTRVGVIGESGAGKSTLLDLVCGFHAPTSGHITYDGHAIDRRALRRRMALMSQDAFLWNATLRENIRLGRPQASDADVVEAAVRAGADAFIGGLERGYDTIAGDRGGQLSGGQRQRVALARLFLRDPVLVVLDEPTSALDIETEAALLPALDALCRGRTSFVVSHRLALVRTLDEVVVLAAGRIVERGAPSVLLADPGSRLSRLSALSA
ncbi:MAG: ABC transporter ATP-binding protein [Polyangia bacterium]